MTPRPLRYSGRRVTVLLGFSTAMAMSIAAPAPVRGDTGGPTCTLPPADRWRTDGGAEVNGVWRRGTFDDAWVSNRSADPGSFSVLVAGLDTEDFEWDEGWGYHSRYDLDLPMARLLNAGQAIRVVQGQHSRFKGFGLQRPVSDPEDYIDDVYANEGRYWDFTVEVTDDEWEPTCESHDDPVADNHLAGADEWNNMHDRGSYRRTVGARASAVLHESVHEHTDHFDVGECPNNPDTSSCDGVYGEFWPATLEINFLHDAVIAVQTEVVEGSRRRRVVSAGNQCSYVPIFHPRHRDAMLLRASSTMKDFKYDAWPGWAQDLEDQVTHRLAGETWECVCSALQYIFDDNRPYTCDQSPACNTLLNRSNKARNDAMFGACLEYNVAVWSNNPADIADAKNDYEAALNINRCLPPAPQDQTAWCESEKAAATNVWLVDPCEWMRQLELRQCREAYCHENFIPPPPPGSMVETNGCRQYACGGPACEGDLSYSDCVLLYDAAGGDPDWYLTTCEGGGCRRSHLKCILEELKADPDFAANWQPGDPVESCDLGLALCESVERFALEAFINLEDVILGPIPEDPLGVRGYRDAPGRDVFPAMEAIRSAVERGASDEIVQAMLRDLTRTPENMVALFHAAPGHFVSLFGTRGFEEFLGPSVRTTAPERLLPADLTPRGQAALRALEELIAATPEGRSLPSVWGQGQIQSQR